MENKDQDINQLLQACKSGDRVAQMTIYRKYYNAMFNTAYRIVNDRQEAEDVMQEAFLSAFTKLDKFYQQSSFGAWLKRIVINCSISHLRKRKLITPLVDEQFKIAEEPESNDDTSYKVKEVINAISSLNENYKIALNLNLIEGYDNEEISELMGITNQNCRTIISRAKAKVRDIMNQNYN